MKKQKRVVAAVLCFSALLVFSGCSSILEDDITSVSAHENPAAPASESVIEANSYEELEARALEFIRGRIETGLIRVNSYDGSIHDDVTRVCIELPSDNPYGAYAVSSMTGTVNKVVSYYEVVLKIDYKNVSKKQIDSIITISTLRYLKSVLEDKLAGYAQSLTVLTRNIPLTEEDAYAMVQEIYYENPMEVVMMPILSVEFYPETGPERIADFTFGYSRYEPSTLKAMAESLEEKDRAIAELVTGGNDDDAILLSLCQKMMEITDYDAEIAQSGDYSNQNIAATAYGALINGSAIGEGYAMAYKSLCDELGFECYVVVGTYEGNPHAWNIVALKGDYYHIDVSMCDVNGIETAFLRNDTDMKESYTWDRSKYEVCDGPLTYASLTAAERNSDNSPEPTT